MIATPWSTDHSVYMHTVSTSLWQVKTNHAVTHSRVIAYAAHNYCNGNRYNSDQDSLQKRYVRTFIKMAMTFIHYHYHAKSSSSLSACVHVHACG